MTRRDSAPNEAWQPVRMDDSPTLFPVEASEFSELARVSATRLHDWSVAGWLSFDLDESPQLEECHLAEAEVVRSILDGGLKPEAARAMLETLSKPYRYEPRRLCYNFHTRSWHSLPARSMAGIEDEIRDELRTELGETAEEYIDELANEGNAAALEELRGAIIDAAERAKLVGGDGE